MSDGESRISQEQCDAVLKAAWDKYQASKNWVDFFREILGLTGVIRRAFPATELQTEFERSDAYREIQYMLRRLRERPDEIDEQLEPTRMITVRLPKSLHESLRIEAHEHRTSMNKLCISKLLQLIDHDRIPAESTPHLPG
jgi:predicted HicB family RNase H-like nuclease